MTDQTVAQPGLGAQVHTAPAEIEQPATVLDQVVEESIQQDLARLEYEEKNFAFQQRRAKLFARSGLFAGAKDLTEEAAIAQAMVKIELGASMGFSAAESLQGIYVINGQTSIAAALRAARMQAAGWDWEIQWLGTEEDCQGVRLWMSRHGKPLLKPVRDDDGHAIGATEQVSVAFTRADAEKMMTTIWGEARGEKKRVSVLEKDNWKMTPRNMYFARAITNAQRWHAPAALSCNLPSAEEIEDQDEPVQQSVAPRFDAGVYRETRARRIAEAEAATAALDAAVAQAAPVAEDPVRFDDIEPDEAPASAAKRQLNLGRRG